MEKLTILIVDDDKTTTSILNHMLYAYTDNILTASDGVEGLELFQEYLQPEIMQDSYYQIVYIANHVVRQHNINQYWY